MADSQTDWRDRVPCLNRLLRLPRQLVGGNPFGGDIKPSRVRLFHPGSSRPTLPFPHPWNFDRPIEILETFFHDANAENESGRHNRYIEVPGLAPVLVTRDPAVIRAITTATGDKAGQFNRDTLPSTGIARATGKDTLLFSNGTEWKRQRKLAASPFGKTTLFQPEMFHEFEETFRETVQQRIDALRSYLQESGETEYRVQLEPEVKTVMLEMLANNFFGAEISYQELREVYVPAIERVIDHIVSDTVMNRLGLPVTRLPAFTIKRKQIKEDYQRFEELTDLSLAPRKTGKGLWKQFKSDSPDELLRSNIKVFLAGALEATTSYATWAISHLARSPECQQKVFEEVQHIDSYSPEKLEQTKYLSSVLDETLRLTPSLYFLPRQATTKTTVETSDRRTLIIPKDTHILLDVWHANRHEDHWGIEKTGSPATEFAPQRWGWLKEQGRASKDMLHFGFGHGPRVCPGKHLGQLETALVVGAIVKVFKFKAVNEDNPVKAGVSTKPADGTLVDLSLRNLEDPRLANAANET